MITREELIDFRQFAINNYEGLPLFSTLTILDDYEKSIKSNMDTEKVCTCVFPGIHNYDNGHTCIKCLLPIKQTE